MFQNKSWEKCRLSDYRRRKACDLSSRSFCLPYSTVRLLFLAYFILFSIPLCASAGNNNQHPNNDSEKPWHIIADEIHYDDKAKQYIGKGNVVITKGDQKLTADFIRFDHKNMKVHAKGHVIMQIGEDTLSGTSIEMDLKSETGTVYDGTIFMKENHFYIKGNKIQKVGKNSYTIDEVSITTCDSDEPAWKITGRNLKVTIEGYGFVKHAALWAKKVPVLYTPFLVFPAKLRRQSGLLLPQIGYSDRKAEEYTQPFYWAINESSDATFYLHHMGLRGEQLGVEYRYVLDENSKGTMMFDFLDDKKVDDGTPGSTENWGYKDDSVLRPNSDRYWFRMKHDQLMPFDFSLKLDVDLVSDQDYLNEFKSGYTGFDKTDSYFHRTFGRDLDDYDDSTRVNRLNLTKSWSTYNLNAEARWYDNVITRRQGGSDTTLQKLPFIEFNALKQPLLNTSSYFDLDSEYTYFFRKDGTKGHRVDVHPRFYLPLRYKHYFSFEPSFGVRETVWRIDEDDNSSAENDWKLHREIYDVKLDFSTEFFKIYNANGKGIKKIKHSIRPQIIYDYIPNDPDLLLYPGFEEVIDRIEKRNVITYSITNRFTSKSRKYTAERDTQLKNNYYNPYYIYREFCRFKLEQSYDINEAKEDNPENWANKEEKRPFSPIYGEFILNTGNYFTMRADAEWCQYESDFLSHNIAVNISDKRGDTLFFEYRYTKEDSIKSLYTDFLVKLSDRLSVYSIYERNLYEDKTIKSGLGFLYSTQCWSIDVGYTHEEDDRRFTFMINLHGLGGLRSGTEGYHM